MLKRIFASFVILTFTLSTSLHAEAFSAVLDKIIEQLQDPEHGYAKVQRAMFDRQVETFYFLLKSDREMMSALLTLTASTILAIEEKIKAEQSEISSQLATLESGLLKSAPWEGLDELFSLSVRSQKLKSDIDLIQVWKRNLKEQIARVMATLKDPCAPSRLEYPKSAFIMRDLMQRKSVTLANFGQDYGSLMDDVFGTAMDVSHLAPPPAHGGYAFSINLYLERGFIQGVKMPYMNEVDSQVLFNSTVALAASTISKDLVISTVKGFLGETAGNMARSFLTSQMASQVLGAVATGMMVLGYAGLAYSVFKLVNGLASAHAEYGKQIHRIQRINEIIRNSLLDRAASEKVVEQLCDSHNKANAKQSDSLISGLQELSDRISNSEFVADETLSARVVSLADRTVMELPKIEAPQLQHAIQRDLQAETRVVGIETGLAKIVQKKLKAAQRDGLAFKTDADREEALLETEFFADVAARSAKSKAYVEPILGLQQQMKEGYK